MDKLDLINCAIIIPVSIDSEERQDHLRFLLRYFPLFFSNYKMIVVEYGKNSKIHGNDKVGFEHIFIEGDDFFSTSKMSNIGVSQIQTPYFIKFDVDAFIHPQALFIALETLKKDPDQAFIFPYNGVSFNILEPLRQELLTNCDLSQLPYIEAEQANTLNTPHLILKNSHSTGLIHLFRTTIFKSLGGYNEEFKGWGYEDDEIVQRFSICGHPPKWLAGFNAFHFNHPRNILDNENLHKQQVIKNHLLSNFISTLNSEEIKDYIKIWSRF